MNEIVLPGPAGNQNGHALAIARSYLRTERVFILFMTATLLWPHKMAWEIGWPWNLSRIAFVLFFLVWLVAWRRGEVKPQRTPLDAAFLLFFAAMLVSVLVNSRGMSMDEYSRSLRNLAFAMIEWFLLYYLVSSIPRDIKQVKKLLIITTGIISLVAIVGIIEYVTSFHFYEWLRPQLPGGENMISSIHGDAARQRSGIERIVSTTPSYMDVGTLMAMAIPLLFYFLAYARTWLHRFACIAALMLVITALGLSVTRGAVIAAVIAMFVVSLFSKKSLLRVGIIISVVASLLVIAFFPKLPEAFETVSSPEVLSTEGSLQGRFDKYPLAMDTLSNHEFFGLGLGQLTGKELTNIKIVDNWYLSHLIETGFVGIAAMSVTWVAIIALFLKRKKLPGNRGSEVRDLRIALLAAIVAFMFLAFSFDALIFLTVSKTFFVLLALGAALHRIESNEAKEGCVATVA